MIDYHGKLAALIRDVPDFPKPGIIFKDITPLLKDPAGFALATELLAGPFRGQGIELVAGIEARGFIFGAAVAQALAVGFVPVRKPGKLPAKTTSATYQLEYGTDSVEIHTDAIKPGQRILIVDDLLATGGTLQATYRLIEQLGGKIEAAAVLIELEFLKGRDKLQGRQLISILRYN